MKVVSIIRDRGQLTIPASIRQIATWATPMSAVTVDLTDQDEIVLTPHQSQPQDMDKLWKRIHRVRSYTGKGQGNLAKYIAQDRKTRK